MQTIMEMVNKYSIPVMETGASTKLTANEELATDADMKSLSGFGDNMFYNNAKLRQEVIRKAGFKLFVKPEFVLNFKYAASIYNMIHVPCHAHQGLVCNGKETPNGHYSFADGMFRPYYKGHLPISVLNKVRVAVGMGTAYITIHSNDVFMLSDVTKADPVIVGWHGFGNLYDYFVCNNSPNEIPRWYCKYEPGRSLRNPFGFIIAIFGGEEVI